MSDNTRIEVFSNDVGDDIHLHIDYNGSDARTAFVQHGLSGSITDALYVTLRQAYFDNGWNVIALEASNSLNGAGGDLSNFTIERHIDDLTNAINWSKSQEIINGSIALCGHSMGGHSVLRNAALLGNEVDHVIASGPVTSGQNLQDAWKVHPEWNYDEWREKGTLEFDNMIPTGLQKGSIPFCAWDEWIQHDITDYINNISAPVLFVVGAEDGGTTPQHVRSSYERIASQSDYHIIDRATHCYSENLTGLDKVVRDYIQKHRR